MQLMATILEETAGAAIAAIGALPPIIDGIELRVDSFDGDAALEPIRAASSRPMILTRRSTPGRRLPFDAALLERAIGAGFDLIDVEIDSDPDPRFIREHAERIVLSLHDYDGVPELPPLIARMAGQRCAHAKIAATPGSFAENRMLLEALVRFRGSFGERLTVIGMGERGLYSRILAPFFGSELVFVSASDRVAAPGQLSLDRALAIYGRPEERQAEARPVAIFAVVGNPAGLSLSPSLHNPLFRRRGELAAYSIASTDSFDEIVGPLAAGGSFAPLGLSVTAPFKEEAFRFARSVNATMGANAREARSVNTLIRCGAGNPVDSGQRTANRPRTAPARAIFADNTDVDAFQSAMTQLCGRDRKTAALIGAGGTARAAAVALRRASMHAIVFNRSEQKGVALADEFGFRFEPLSELGRFDGEVVINTLPGAAPFEVPRSLFRAGHALVDVDYSGARAALIDAAVQAGMQVVAGREILESQAARQNDLFCAALRDTGALCEAAPLEAG